MIKAQIVQAGLEVEEIALALSSLAYKLGRFVSGLDNDQTRKELVELQRLMIQQGIQPKNYQWTFELTRDCRALYGALVRQAETGETLPLAAKAREIDLASIDFEAAVTELRSWGVLDESEEGVKLRKLMSEPEWPWEKRASQSE